MGKQAVNKTTAAADAKAKVAAEKAEAKAVAKVAKKMGGTVYDMTNKETQEVTKVMPHTFNTGYVLFAKAELEGTDEWATVAEADMFRFENPNNDGKLTSETYDIAIAEDKESVTPEAENAPADLAGFLPEDKYKGMKIAGRTILSSRLKDVHGRMLTEISLDTGETMLFSTEELDARLSPEN